MNYEQYTKLYRRDNHNRKDALPTPLKAKKIANELSKRHTPGVTTVRSQILLAQMFGISTQTLIRFQKITANDHLHKYMTLTGENKSKALRRTKHEIKQT
ncbi:hypothetical protein [Leuconostoc pseudomesenteroides]|uniref:hypothetical protein n=1 Tax=Leuconostoc pseudomesenteroides TaxID=33968 RepID=UPI004036EA65